MLGRLQIWRGEIVLEDGSWGWGSDQYIEMRGFGGAKWSERYRWGDV